MRSCSWHRPPATISGARFSNSFRSREKTCGRSLKGLLRDGFVRWAALFSPALGFTPRCSCRKTHCQRHSREAFGYFLSRASSNGTGPPPSEEVLPPRLAPDGSSAGIKRPVALPLLPPSCGSTGSEDEACSLGLLCPHNRTSSCRLLALWRGLIARPPSRGAKVSTSSVPCRPR
jgi:hypothetical protein